MNKIYFKNEVQKIQVQKSGLDCSLIKNIMASVSVAMLIVLRTLLTSIERYDFRLVQLTNSASGKTEKFSHESFQKLIKLTCY